MVCPSRLRTASLAAAVAAVAALLPWTAGSVASGSTSAAQACPPLEESRPISQATQAPSPAPATPVHGAASDYRHRLQPTPLGWIHRSRWCVWLEPASAEGPGALWEQRWRRAVTAALQSWQSLLPITLVDDPGQAQVRLHRRRPPLRTEAGAWRASHGRAELQLLEVRRQGLWRREPLVEVLISPGQHERAIQATALHELGHAFGLWGHSDQAGDAMAAVPGAKPVLTLSPRDRATLRWLQNQFSQFNL